MKTLILLLVAIPTALFAQIDTNPPALTQVYFPTWGFSGVSQKAPLTLTPVNNWLTDGVRIIAGKPLLVTNTAQAVPLIPNDYIGTIQGISGSFMIHVPASTNILNAVILSSNLNTFCYATPMGPWQAQLIATNAILARLSILGTIFHGNSQIPPVF